MLEQRDNVRKCFMKSKNVGIGWFYGSQMQAMKKRMSGFVRNDVMRYCREHNATWQDAPNTFCRRCKIAQQQRFAVGTIVGVLGAQGMRIDAQALHELGSDDLT